MLRPGLQHGAGEVRVAAGGRNGAAMAGARVGRQADIGAAAGDHGEARHFPVFQRQQGGRAQRRRVLPAHVGQDAVPHALRPRQHAFRPAAVLEARLRHVPADEAVLRAAEPELPVLEALAHVLVEPQAALEDRAAGQAAGLAVVLDQVQEVRVFAADREVHLVPEHVHIRIGPADLGGGGFQHVPGAPQEVGPQPVVRIQEIDGAAPGPGGQGEVDAGVARGAEAAVAAAHVKDAAGMAARQGQAGVAGLRHGAAIVHDHSGDAQPAALRQHGSNRLRQEARLLKDRNNDGDVAMVGYGFGLGRQWIGISLGILGAHPGLRQEQPVCSNQPYMRPPRMEQLEIVESAPVRGRS
jgi:hypothetical protein